MHDPTAGGKGCRISKAHKRTEAGMPPEEGGVNLPPNDGVTNEPMKGEPQDQQPQPNDDDIGDIDDE